MDEMENLIGEFDETKVTLVENDFRKYVLYDITEQINKLVEDKESSLLKYVVKVEAEIYYLSFDDEEDYLVEVKESFEDITGARFRELGIFTEKDGICVKNDSRLIRLTFANGSVMDVHNSEWGSITLKK